MVSIIITILMLAALSLQVPSASSNQEHDFNAALPPTEDPFYAAPPGFELNSPGTILRIRPDPGNITTVLTNISSAFNILYRTTDSRYEPAWAVTTLLIPKSRLPGNQSLLLSYHIAYNSADVNASPSYLLSTLYTQPLPNHAPTEDIDAALGRGWVVNVPDFEGPLAACFSGPQEGHAILDSVRAVLSWDGDPSLRNARYAMWGFSGGAFASLFAAELQPAYAPELDFAGAAIGGLIGNITQTYLSLNSTTASSLLPAILLGVTAQYPEARGSLISQLRTTGPRNATGFLAALHMSTLDNSAVFSGQNIDEYFSEGSVAVLQSPQISQVLNSTGNLGFHGIPQMPLFVYRAIGDRASPTSTIDALLEKYCDMGVTMKYQRNEYGGHVTEFPIGVQRAMEWLQDILETGSVPDRGCIVENVNVNSTASTDRTALINDRSVNDKAPVKSWPTLVRDDNVWDI